MYDLFILIFSFPSSGISFFKKIKNDNFHFKKEKFSLQIFGINEIFFKIFHFSLVYGNFFQLSKMKISI
jgi:hypothetical protein